MELLILGTGCDKCTRLEQMTRQTADEMGLDYTLRKVGEIDEIIAHGVMVTPALVRDGKVMCVGKVPSPEELRGYLV
ncbi:hypothetical protein CSA17_02255 [bacterium DOLJORAL78_65_58]|nr:MAG: hypothetical protein CSB20_09555 [bacterium DOLZORAL124_64_63]PIE76436.1 MAG: hypothetical protein CSA17_02255 [bacterium DOLJORAL78_65_58]